MIRETWALTIRELKRWSSALSAVLLTFVTPIFWLGLFGRSLNFDRMLSFQESANMDPSLAAAFEDAKVERMMSLFGTTDYFTFLASGILAVFVLFGSMFPAVSMVWDRRFGFLSKLLVAPIPRELIFFSRVLASVIRGALQLIAIFMIAMLFGLRLGEGFGPLQALGILAALMLLTVGVSSLVIGMAASVTRIETLVIASSLLHLPIMFTSNALFPIKQMPLWLQTVAQLNPLTYASDAVRSLILLRSIDLSFNFMFLTAFALVGLTVGALITRTVLNR